MSEEVDKPKCPTKQDHGDNGFWGFKRAVDEKTTCHSCGFGGGPFLLQGARMSAAQPVPVAPVYVCENISSEHYMAIKAGLGSCRLWKEKQAVQASKIVIAHKPVPPLKISNLKGDEK